MKKIFVAIIGLFCVGNAMSATTADPTLWNRPSKWAISVGGTGRSMTSDNVGTAMGASVEVGRTGKLLLPIVAGARQRITYDGNSTTFATTSAYCDWDIMSINSVDVFVGGNVGITYGNTAPLWEIAPEFGMRWWVKDGVAIIGRADFPFDMDGGKFEDTVRYFIGIEIRL